MKVVKEKYLTSKEILHLLFNGAILASVFLMPGLATLLPKPQNEWEGVDIYRLRQSLKRLKRRKAIKVMEKDGESVIVLTNKGKDEALRFNLSNMRLDKEKKWNRKWYLVVFDIAEDKKRIREAIRFKLKDLDFYKLQDSVFISPYPCFKEIEFLRNYFGVEDEISLLVVEKVELEEEKFLKKYYQLR